jgi:ATP-dependent DNA helicase RecG
VSVHLLTGSLGRSARGPARAAAEGGEPGVWVGTHALIQEAVAFADLAVVAVDEQHRFGVAQRARLAGKASAPNLIAMSATPIPRTLALALYADFDLSVVDELPPGRQPVATRLLSARSRDTAYAALRETAEGGQQGFVVCPLIEPSPALEAEAATEHVEALRAGPLAGLRLGLVHGRMPPDERQAVMEAFYGGLVDVLVSTTVIEVGLDVPNASAIVVENAERFGLAQLHQLRGRVARSRHRPRCFLLKGSGGEEANRRLEVLVQTEDGFRIAEADLEQRGAGELAGLRQHGAGDWLVGDVLRHPDLLAAAREDAAAILGADPALGRPEHAGLAAAVGAMAPVADGGWAL